MRESFGAVDNPQDERRINKVEMPRLGGLAVILGFIISVSYLLVSLNVDKKIDLLEDSYNIKLIGFFVRNGYYCFYLFY
ncbi:MAG: hypothetical protein IKG42_06100 [Clostridia bacterium]|nr:hypothetical protein [Clostridia bacterium]